MRTDRRKRDDPREYSSTLRRLTLILEAQKIEDPDMLGRLMMMMLGSEKPYKLLQT
jgi:hypothetical protein